MKYSSPAINMKASGNPAAVSANWREIMKAKKVSAANVL